MNQVRVGVIGCGQRLRFLTKILGAEAGVKIVGAWDPEAENAKKLLESAGSPDGRVYESYQALAADPNIDWIMVGSPNAFHKEHILAGFAAGKHVFTEKPLATRTADCVAINEAHGRSGKLFATGFVLRYSPLYRKAKEILASGALGKIVSIDANENIAPDHGAYIMVNWRRHKELSGPHILEKCVHDLDLLNWFTESVPVRVAAFGGNGYFVPENRENFSSHKKEYGSWFTRLGVEEGSDPFVMEKTIEDHVVSILDYAGGMRVQFQATMANPIPERRMYFHCTRGNMVLELYSGLLQVKVLGQEKTETYDFSKGDGHGGGDTVIMNELAESMRTGREPKCGGEEGLRSAVVGIAIEQARVEGKVLDLSGLWRELGVLPGNKANASVRVPVDV